MNSEVLTLSEVAAYLKVNDKTIYRLLQRKEIPAFKVAGSWRFKEKDLQVWIESKKNTPPPPKGRTHEERT